MKLPPIFAAALLGMAVPALAASSHDHTIVDTAVASPDHTTLVAAVKAADLADALSGEGPFTVFAPTDVAFSNLPEGTVQTLLQPDNQAQLQAVLTYHVVAGKVSSSDLLAMIEKNDGTAKLTTLEGGFLAASLNDGKVTITDENGGEATVVAADLDASNGMIHVTDAVSLPG